MKLNKILLLLLITISSLVFSERVSASTISNLQVNTEAGFNDLQGPFSEFLNSASQVSVSKESTSWPIFTDKAEEAQKSWQEANDWLKEKTGLDIWGCLKVIGGILIFVMNLSIQIMTATVNAIQWLLSLIPNPSS